MRLLIVCGMLALALGSLTPATARSFIGIFCPSHCGVTGASRTRVIAPSLRTCVADCMAGKKDTQH